MFVMLLVTLHIRACRVYIRQPDTAGFRFYGSTRTTAVCIAWQQHVTEFIKPK